MVFFVCETCNETLKKNQVEKHVYKCRNCQAVTCVDCSVTFYGNDYEQHTTCISEDQKHHGTLYKAKKVKLNPQDAWVALIEDVTSRVSEAPVFIQSHLTRLGELNNVPRNKAKFINFCKNSLKLYNDNILEGLWAHLESCKKATEAANAPEPKAATATPENNTKANESTSTGTTVPEVSEVSGGDDKKSKKAKKDKKDKKDKNEETVAAVTEETVAETTEDASSSDKKKSKKNKRDTEDASESENKKHKKSKKDEEAPVVAAESADVVTEDKKEKKKKSKKSKSEHDD